MNKKDRNSYTAEFKAEAVKLVLDEHHSVTEVSHRLGIPIQTFSTWLSRARSGRMVGTSQHNQSITSLEAEVKHWHWSRQKLNSNVNRSTIPNPVCHGNWQILEQLKAQKQTILDEIELTKVQHGELKMQVDLMESVTRGLR